MSDALCLNYKSNCGLSDALNLLCWVKHQLPSVAPLPPFAFKIRIVEMVWWQWHREAILSCCSVWHFKWINLIKVFFLFLAFMNSIYFENFFMLYVGALHPVHWWHYIVGSVVHKGRTLWSWEKKMHNADWPSRSTSGCERWKDVQH